jgi:hypothetical protein
MGLRIAKIMNRENVLQVIVPYGTIAMSTSSHTGALQ